jgi:hypothetical protein
MLQKHDDKPAPPKATFLKGEFTTFDVSEEIHRAFSMNGFFGAGLCWKRRNSTTLCLLLVSTNQREKTEVGEEEEKKKELLRSKSFDFLLKTIT